MIYGFTGLNGSGKTMRAVSLVLEMAERFPDRDVLSSLPLDTPGYVELSDWQQIVDRFYYDPETGDWEVKAPFILLLDEVVGLADSRSTMRLPAHVLLLLCMFRHVDVIVVWTTIAFSFVDVRLRMVTQVVYDCEGAAGRRVEGQAWPDYRLSLAWRHRLRGDEGSKLPPRILWFLPHVLVIKRAKGYGRYPKRRRPAALSEFAPICPHCGLERRRRREYCACPKAARGVVS